MEDIQGTSYVGGQLSATRHASYGNQPFRAKTKAELSGGFKAPPPSRKGQLTYTHPARPGPQVKKRQKKFKTSLGGTAELIADEVKDMAGDLGMAPKTMKLLSEAIKKERAKFRSIMNKGATALKKQVRLQGGTKKQSMDEKKRHQDAMKEGLKKAIAQHTLMALKQFNNRLA